MSEDKFVEVNGEKIKIPDIALGKFMPDSVNALILKCEIVNYNFGGLGFIAIAQWVNLL